MHIEKYCLLLLVSYLSFSSTLKMEAIFSSETSGCLRITECNNPEHHVIRSPKCNVILSIHHKFHSTQFICKLKIFIQFFTLRHVSAVFGHHHIRFFTLTLKFFCYFLPTLAKVYIWGKAHMRCL
jgi:hypothetical protein